MQLSSLLANGFGFKKGLSGIPKQIGLRPFPFVTVLGILAALLFASCGGGSDVTWTIHTESKTAMDDQYLEQDFIWDPINNEIVGYENDMESGSGKEEVREAGFSTSPNGYLLSEETTLGYSKKRADQTMTFRFDGDFSDGIPEGEFIVNTWIDGEPQNQANGEFYITPGLGDDETVQEFLSTNSHSYLYAEAKKDIGNGKTDQALAKLDKVIELVPEHISAWRKKVGIYLAGGEAETALEAVNAALEEDSDNLSALEQKFDLLMATSDYKNALSVREELFEKQQKRDEKEGLTIPSYASKKTDAYYLEEYYVLDAYMDMADAALLAGDYERAKEKISLAEEDMDSHLSTYNMIYNPKQRSFSVPFYRKLDVYSLTARLDVYQILYAFKEVREGTADFTNLDEYFGYLDGLVIRDFSSDMGVRPREIDEMSWKPAGIYKDMDGPGSDWQIGKMTRRPKDLLLTDFSIPPDVLEEMEDEASLPQSHPETIAAFASWLPLFAASGDPGWSFAEELESNILSRLEKMDEQFVPLIKKYAGFDEGEKAEEFDRKIQNGNSDFLSEKILAPEHFIREFDSDVDITMPGSDFVEMNSGYMQALLYLGEPEAANSFGLMEYFTPPQIEETAIELLRPQNPDWTVIKDDLDYLIGEGYRPYTKNLLETLLKNPEYRDQRDRLNQAIGYLQMHG